MNANRIKALYDSFYGSYDDVLDLEHSEEMLADEVLRLNVTIDAHKVEILDLKQDNARFRAEVLANRNVVAFAKKWVLPMVATISLLAVVAAALVSTLVMGAINAH